MLIEDQSTNQESIAYQQKFNKICLDPKNTEKLGPSHISINSNVFNINQLPSQFKQILKFYNQRNFYYGSQIRKQDAWKSLLDNMKGNVQSMSLQEGRFILWQQLFPQTHSRSDTALFELDKIVNRVRSYGYNYMHITNKIYQNGIDQQLDHLQFQGQRLQQDLLEQLGVIRNKIRKDQSNARDLAWMKIMILKVERQVFFDSIVAIQQLDPSNIAYKRIQIQNDDILVKIYLQQCYPYLIMEKKELLIQFGQKVYSYLLKKMPLHQSEITERLKQSAVISCHYCQGVLEKNQTVYPCSTLLTMEHLKPTLLTNPQLYHQVLHGFDYTDPCGYRAIRPDYSHPYLTYHHFIKKKDKKKAMQPVCRRVYCQGCYNHQIIGNQSAVTLQNPYKKQKQSEVANFFCKYCEGNCRCPRCRKMDFVIKATAYYMKLGGSLQSIISNFVFANCRKCKPNIERINKGTGRRLYQNIHLRETKRKIRALQIIYAEGGVVSIPDKKVEQYNEQEKQMEQKERKQKTKHVSKRRSRKLIDLNRIDLGLGNLIQRQKGVDASIIVKGYGEGDSQSFDGIQSFQHSSSSGQQPYGNIQAKLFKSCNNKEKFRQQQARRLRLKQLQKIKAERLHRKKQKQKKRNINNRKRQAKKKQKNTQTKTKKNNKNNTCLVLNHIIMQQENQDEAQAAIFQEQDY